MDIKHMKFATDTKLGESAGRGLGFKIVLMNKRKDLKRTGHIQ